MEILVRNAGAKKVEALFDGTTVMTDQTPKDGGEGSAPTPFDLFLTSLATCSGYYVYDFCQAREIPIDGVTVHMKAERDEAKKMLDRITIDIRLPAGFPEKYEKAVVRAANLCSVKKHLMDPPAIEVFASRAEG